MNMYAGSWYCMAIIALHDDGMKFIPVYYLEKQF
jgi:hypothetical protein